MPSQTDQLLNLNLGKYTIKNNNDTEAINVGAFWRLRSESSDNNWDTTQTTETTEGQSARGLSNSDSTNEKIDLPDGSLSDQAKLSDFELEFQSTNLPQDLTNDGNLLRSEISNHTTESSVISDPPKNKPTTSYDTNDDSHESMVTSVNPNHVISPNDDSSNPTIHQEIRRSQGLGQFTVYTPKAPKRMRKKVYPKQRPYDKIMSDITFVMSGYENPRRAKLRDIAISMGARYSPKWNRFCTHLICAFKNTPKYKEVMAESGRIVREHWIQECDKQCQLLDWRNFKLGQYPYPDSEEEDDEVDDDLDYALEVGYGIKPKKTKR